MHNVTQSEITKTFSLDAHHFYVPLFNIEISHLFNIEISHIITFFYANKDLHFNLLLQSLHNLL